MAWFAPQLLAASRLLPLFCLLLHCAYRGTASSASADIGLNRRATENSHELNTNESPDEVALRRLEGLHDGQTIFLDSQKIRLSRTVYIDASNVVIRGVDGLTEVSCPPSGSAFVIKSTNVTLTRLAVKDCNDRSAISIERNERRFDNGKGAKGETRKIRNRTDSKAEVFLNHCIFASNYAEKGAAIFAERTSLQINNSTFKANWAEQGGAVFSSDGSELSVRSSKFFDSFAESGGAIQATENSIVSIAASVFSNNLAARTGGSMNVDEASQVNIQESQFRYNAAVENGGSLCIADKSHVSIEFSTFSNTGSKFGGCILMFGSTLNINHSTFAESNAETSGGVLYVDEASRVDIQGSQFRNNSAPNGGSLYMADNSQISITSSSFSNTTSQLGGCVFIFGSTLNVADSTFAESKADDFGGVLYADKASQVNVQGSQFRYNAAPKGGSLYIAAKSVVSIESSTFSNTTSQLGGCIEMFGSTLNVTNSTFAESKADNSGGVLYVAEASQVNVQESQFRNNTAVENGGSLYIEDNSQVSIGFSTFSNTASKFGGCILMLGSTLNINHSTFAESNAETSGGVLYVDEASRVDIQGSQFRNNVAPNGGSLYIEDNSQVSIRSTTFSNSWSESGGCILMFGSTLNVVDSAFIKNSARNSGGALYLDREARVEIQLCKFHGNRAAIGGSLFAASKTRLSIRSSDFRNNSAELGGAVLAKDCELVELGRNAMNAGVNFTRNSALVGGAIQLELETISSAEYKVENCQFTHNTAIESDSPAVRDSPALYPSEEGSYRALLRHELNRLSVCVNCRARGGALFIGLRRQYTNENTTVQLSNVLIDNNNASIGGGGYILCDWDKHKDQKGCSLIEFRRVMITNNTAAITAGGLFINAIEDLTLYRIGSSRANKEVTHVHLQNNQIDVQCGGYGPDLATDASSLNLVNVDGRLGSFAPGMLLGVPMGEEAQVAGISVMGIPVAVLDALGQRVTGGNDDSSLEVVLDARWIAGERRYEARNGLIQISNTYVAGVNKSDEVIIRSVDEREISVAVTFSTLACTEEELPMNSDASSFRCDSHNSYTFLPNDVCCLPCEEHSICDGAAALIPEEGQWHSSPFSPKMRRCLSKEACAYKDRTARLREYYYKDLRRRLADFQEANSSDASPSDFLHGYDQCSSGHTGIICGSCEDGYGHAADGECVECSLTLAVTRCLTALILLLLFGVVTIKIYFNNNGVKAEAELLVEKEKERTRSTLAAASENRARFEEFGRQTAHSTAESPRLRRSHSETIVRYPATRPEETAVPARDEGSPEITLINRASRPPTLPRASAIEDPTSRPGRNVQLRIKAMKASGALTDTYNIAYNYIQLNAVALCLDVYWNGALQHLLSIQALLGRITGIKFLPFDCNFGDKKHDVGIPNSLASLWIRVCFPVVTIGIYMFAINFHKRTQPALRRRRYELDTLPRARLVAFMVYLAFCIDIFGYLLRAFHCVELQSVDPNHPYAGYEVLGRVKLWVGDTSLTCWEGAHLWSAIAAAIGLVLCFGTFVLMALILWRGRAANRLEDPNFLLNYGVLYLGYKQKGLALYWEVVLTARRIAVAFISEFANSGDASNLQIGLIAMTIFAFVVLHLIIEPYDNVDSKDTFPPYAGSSFRLVKADWLADRWVSFNQRISLNGIESTSLLISLSLFWTATSISGHEGYKNEVSLLLSISFVLNSLFFAFMLYRLWYSVHHYLDVVAHEGSIFFKQNRALGEAEDGNTYLLFKLRVFLKHWIKFGWDDTEIVQA